MVAQNTLFMAVQHLDNGSYIHPWCLPTQVHADDLARTTPEQLAETRQSTQRTLERSRQMAHDFSGRFPACCPGCKKRFHTLGDVNAHHEEMSATEVRNYPLKHCGQRRAESPFWDVQLPICVCMLHFILQQVQATHPSTPHMLYCLTNLCCARSGMFNLALHCRAPCERCRVDEGGHCLHGDQWHPVWQGDAKVI